MNSSKGIIFNLYLRYTPKGYRSIFVKERETISFELQTLRHDLPQIRNLKY